LHAPIFGSTVAAKLGPGDVVVGAAVVVGVPVAGVPVVVAVVAGTTPVVGVDVVEGVGPEELLQP